MIKAWDAMKNDDHFAEISEEIQAGVDVLQKYYDHMDCAPAYFICLGKSSLDMLAP
jgi:hypothetical protein